MGTLAAAPGEVYQVSQCAFAFFDVNVTLDATARPTNRAEKGMNRAHRSGARNSKGPAAMVTDAPGGTDATAGREMGHGDGRAKVRRTDGSGTDVGLDEAMVEAGRLEVRLKACQQTSGDG